MSPASTPSDREEIPVVPLAALPRLVRGTLVLIAVGWLAVFGIARWLNPYGEDGTPRRMETHRQLGLPPCSFAELTKKPCPSCGMTTSFALLAHGDLKNSLAANWVGTLLALAGVVAVPWCLVAAWRGQLPFVRSGERLLMWAVGLYVGLALLRWCVVVVPGWLFGDG